MKIGEMLKYSEFATPVIAKEISINTHGLNFLCIVGTHIKGGFVAMPEWNVSAELARGDRGYNKQKIETALNESSWAAAWLDRTAQSEVAAELAEVLTKYIKK